MPNDRDRGKRAVERVLDTFYRNIGTPPPAPGIERLAFFAVEAAYTALRRAWEEELFSDDAIDAAARAVFDASGSDGHYDTLSERERHHLRAGARQTIVKAVATTPRLGVDDWKGQ